MISDNNSVVYCAFSTVSHVLNGFSVCLHFTKFAFRTLRCATWNEEMSLRLPAHILCELHSVLFRFRFMLFVKDACQLLLYCLWWRCFEVSKLEISRRFAREAKRFSAWIIEFHSRMFVWNFEHVHMILQAVEWTQFRYGIQMFSDNDQAIYLKIFLLFHFNNFEHNFGQHAKFEYIKIVVWKYQTQCA